MLLSFSILRQNKILIFNIFCYQSSALYVQMHNQSSCKIAYCKYCLAQKSVIPVYTSVLGNIAEKYAMISLFNIYDNIIRNLFQWQKFIYSPFFSNKKDHSSIGLMVLISLDSSTRYASKMTAGKRLLLIFTFSLLFALLASLGISRFGRISSLPSSWPFRTLARRLPILQFP